MLPLNFIATLPAPRVAYYGRYPSATDTLSAVTGGGDRNKLARYGKRLPASPSAGGAAIGVDVAGTVITLIQ
jgi:hypothetical protein